MQVWFCPTQLDQCVLRPEGKWIINYLLDIPDKWPVRLGTSLTQAEVISLESGGFILEDVLALKVRAVAHVSNVLDIKDSSCVNVTSNDIPKNAYLFLLRYHCNLF